MAHATPQNIEHLSKIVKQIKPIGHTQYKKAIKLAFSLLGKAFEEDVAKVCKYRYHVFCVLYAFSKAKHLNLTITTTAIRQSDGRL